MTVGEDSQPPHRNIEPVATAVVKHLVRILVVRLYGVGRKFTPFAPIPSVVVA